MRFTTLPFFIFFIIAYVAYWNIKGRNRLWLLFVSSLLFYAAWSIGFTLHFILIITINYFLGRRLHEKKSKPILIASLLLNFSNLFLFKYFYLFLQALHDLTKNPLLLAENFNAILNKTTGLDSIVLPLAISFYTFQITAFLIDEYRGQIKNKTSFLEFAVFILFFPQLVAGPIMRHEEFLPKLHKIRADEGHISAGLFFLLLGLIKKVVIADNMIAPTTDVYLHPENYNGLSNAFATLGYAVRLYNDFSGYTDIARGIGLLLGLPLPLNFKGPYLALSIKDFWRRWHITLSSWLRDYIYIPLGGNRTTKLRSYINLVITFTLGGMWHGAAYTFVAWGFYTGVTLVAEQSLHSLFGRLAQNNKGVIAETLFAHKAQWIWKIIGNALLYTWTLGLFLIGLSFFNGINLQNALTMVQRIFTMARGIANPLNEFIFYQFLITILFNLLEVRGKRIFHENRFLTWGSLCLFTVVTMLLLGRYASGGGDFIYFQF